MLLLCHRESPVTRINYKEKDFMDPVWRLRIKLEVLLQLNMLLLHATLVPDPDICGHGRG